MDDKDLITQSYAMIYECFLGCVTYGRGEGGGGRGRGRAAFYNLSCAVCCCCFTKTVIL